MTLRAYHLHLGGMAWAFSAPAIPLPVSWLRFASAPPTRPGAERVDVSFAFASPGRLDSLAGQLADRAGGADVAHAATHPEGGWREEILWAGESLIGRRDDAPWAVAEQVAGGEAGRWRVSLSDVDPAGAQRAFFEVLAPFMLGAECARRGGFILHGNAVLAPNELRGGGSPGLRASLLIVGPSETGKSTLSRLLVRGSSRFELLAEDRTILMPIRDGGSEGKGVGTAARIGVGYCAFPYPTSGELWARSARSARKSNQIAGFVFPRRGNDNRCRVVEKVEAFPLLWEQALRPLYPKERATKLVDSLLGVVEQSPATAYAFMRRSQAAESLESVLGDIFGLRPLVEATRRRGPAPF